MTPPKSSVYERLMGLLDTEMFYFHAGEMDKSVQDPECAEVCIRHSDFLRMEAEARALAEEVREVAGEMYADADAIDEANDGAVHPDDSAKAESGTQRDWANRLAPDTPREP